jgi:predicted aldo/keto reductase-like oxidoreductase
VRSYPQDLKHLGFEMYEALEVGAEGCVECEECLEKCPAGLPIPEMLKEAGELLTSGNGE